MIICELCGKECDSERGLNIHLARKHKDSVSSSKKPPQPFRIPNHTHSVPLGTVVKLSGEVFVQDPSTKEFATDQADGLTARVVHKEFQPVANQTFLFCSVYRVSDRLWAILEEDVLNGKFPIVSWGESLSTSLSLAPLTPTADITMEEPFDPQERDAYLDAVSEYSQARDSKNSAEAHYVKVDKETRKVIIEYVSKFGVETQKGKSDSKLIDGGWDVHWANSPGKAYVQRDEGRIVQWLLDNGNEECLKKVLNIDKWEELKKSGNVPAEFIAEVEIPKVSDPIRKLMVQREKA